MAAPGSTVSLSASLAGVISEFSPGHRSECSQLTAMKKYINIKCLTRFIAAKSYSLEYDTSHPRLAFAEATWDETWVRRNPKSEPATRRKASLRCPVDVFAYHDYRLFLSDFYSAKKPQGFSYRAFSVAAGLGAPNYLQLVILGKRNLSQEMASVFASTCGLAREAARYFVTLVAFNQATSAAERNSNYALLASFTRYRKAHHLALAEAAYHSTWYLPAVRELALSPYFRSDASWIAERLEPPISVDDARAAIDTLLQLGMLRKDEDGNLKQHTSVVSTGPLGGLHLRNYHAEMMQRATAALENIPAAERDLTALTMCVSPEAFSRIKARLAELRREIIDICETDVSPRQLFQLNLQLFPLSRDASLGQVNPDADAQTKL
jgi:uncharacterized protein (TIGR02147 family)